MNKKIILLSLVLFALVTPSAFAVTGTSTDSALPRPIKDRIENKKIITENLRDKKLALAETSREKRIEFQEKLAGLKDERKKIIIERIDKKLAAINLNSTDHMTSSIEKMKVLLQKFSDRAEKLKSEGTDTSEVETAITEAETAILSAKTAIGAQSEKEYSAELSEETGLRNSMGEVMKLLRQDLNETRDIVKNAKKEVMDVARVLGKFKPASLTPTLTPVPTI